MLNSVVRIKTLNELLKLDGFFYDVMPSQPFRGACVYEEVDDSLIIRVTPLETKLLGKVATVVKVDEETGLTLLVEYEGKKRYMEWVTVNMVEKLD